MVWQKQKREKVRKGYFFHDLKELNAAIKYTLGYDL